MSKVTKRVFYSNSSWVDKVEHVRETGRLTIVTDKGAYIEYQVPVTSFKALERRCETKLNKQGEPSVGSAVNEFISENCDSNVKGTREAAEVMVAGMSELERSSMRRALVQADLQSGLL